MEHLNLEQPPNPLSCPMCLGMQAFFDPLSQKLGPECIVCHGTGWVDLGLVCYCGRAATVWDGSEKTWYCGEVVCEPKKHPRQNAERRSKASGKPPEPPPVAYDVDDDSISGWMERGGVWY